MISFQLTVAKSKETLLKAALAKLALKVSSSTSTTSTYKATITSTTSGKDVPVATIFKLGRMAENMLIYESEVKGGEAYLSQLFIDKQNTIKGSTLAL